MHTAAIIIRGRYAKENPQITISDAIWEFIKERDPELAEETLEAIRMQDRLNQLYGGAATTS